MRKQLFTDDDDDDNEEEEDSDKNYQSKITIEKSKPSFESLIDGRERDKVSPFTTASIYSEEVTSSLFESPIATSPHPNNRPPIPLFGDESNEESDIVLKSAKKIPQPLFGVEDSDESDYLNDSTSERKSPMPDDAEDLKKELTLERFRVAELEQLLSRADQKIQQLEKEVSRYRKAQSDQQVSGDSRWDLLAAEEQQNRNRRKQRVVRQEQQQQRRRRQDPITRRASMSNKTIKSSRRAESPVKNGSSIVDAEKSILSKNGNNTVASQPSNVSLASPYGQEEEAVDIEDGSDFSASDSSDFSDSDTNDERNGTQDTGNLINTAPPRINPPRAPTRPKNFPSDQRREVEGKKDFVVDSDSFLRTKSSKQEPVEGEENIDVEADTVVLRWASGKTFIDMLLTISEVWPQASAPKNQGALRGSGTSNVAVALVRREYLRVVRAIHPDKQSKEATNRERVLSGKLFAAFTDAYRYFIESDTST